MRRSILFVVAMLGCRHELAEPICVEDPGDPRCLAATDDAGVDSGNVDSMPVACSGASSEACGKCGTRTRTCQSDGTWTAWGACESEGVCTPDTIETVATACPGALEKRTRKCSASCTWEAEVCALPKGWTKIADSPIEGRLDASAVWTGGEMIVFGGGRTEKGPAMNDGAIYSLADDHWTVLPTTGAPTARRGHVATWNGRDMLVWGGSDGSTSRCDGYIYDAFAKAWSKIDSSPFAKCSGAAAVWVPTRNVSFLWGGGDLPAGTTDAVLMDGTSWTVVPKSPLSARAHPFVAWTGTEVLVFGGYDLSTAPSTPLNDGALFDPAKNTWRTVPAAPVPGRLFPSAAWVGDRFVFFGGFTPKEPVWNGAVLLTSASPTWSTLPVPDAKVLAPHVYAQTWADGSSLTIWSGMLYDPTGAGTFDEQGASLDPLTGAATPIDVTNAPIPRGYATTLWTGKAALVWSGYASPGGGIADLVKTGGIYVP